MSVYRISPHGCHQEKLNQNCIAKDVFGITIKMQLIESIQEREASGGMNCTFPIVISVPIII